MKKYRAMIKKNKNICVVTTTRAEYGILSGLLQDISKDENLNLKLMVTGTHFSKYFGETYKEIENDGFLSYERIDILEDNDNLFDMSSIMANAIKKFGDFFNKNKMDAIVLLGDRYEILAIAEAAMLNKIPIIHIHGGEKTEGAIDDSIRHCITKLSHLHFTSTEEYRKRVIQLGENPDTVFNVGALAIDNIKNINLLNKGEVEEKIKFKFNKKNILVTFQPETLSVDNGIGQFKALLNYFDSLVDTNIIFTKANIDEGAQEINFLIDDYVKKNKTKTVAFKSMGKLLFFSTMQFVDALVGNSSSGIIEAPSFHIGTINIGNRQKGRLSAVSVINCEGTFELLNKAFLVLYSDEFKKKLQNMENIYGDGKTASKILRILKDYPLENILNKKFYDIGAIDV